MSNLPAEVRRIYEGRPYPAADDRVVKDRPWALSPMPWMMALAQQGTRRPVMERILIAGCGTGHEAFAVKRKLPAAEIVAVDFSPRSIAIARKLQWRNPQFRDIRFRVADLASRGLGGITGRDFDFISCHGVLSYIPNPGRVLRNL